MINCPYKNNPEAPCHISDADWDHLLTSSCERGKYGESCAAILAQMIVLASTGDAGVESALDQNLGNIDSKFRITSIPAGAAPLAIRESLAGGLSLPLRERRPREEGRILVHCVDFHLTLLNSERLKEANWYEKYRVARKAAGDNFDWWAFSESEGRISVLVEPHDSIAEYDMSFRLGSAVFGNATNPPLLLVDKRRRERTN